jgi:hypothetical protein
MSAVPLTAQIQRIAKRVAQLEKFVSACPGDTLTRREKEQELAEYKAIEASLIGLQAALRVAV